MTVNFRPGTLDDSYALHQVFRSALIDLNQRLGLLPATWVDEPERAEKSWQRFRSMLDHLTRTADHFWIAEQEGEAVGFARSILRDGTRELADFFVLPGHQSAGVGRELLKRAFPAEGAQRRIIIATQDSRAVARYLKSGVYPRFSATHFARQPQAETLETDLTFQPLTPDHLPHLDALDSEVIGYRRTVDHRWLMSDREGFLVSRGSQPVGYGYVSDRSGPFALLDAADFPSVLTYAENRSAAQGHEEFGVEVPLHNRPAVGHLLRRGYQMEGFYEFFMTDVPFGRFENYILTGPPLFT
ncbi:MAG: GNAT family N-acetyltransferase [Anaerolineae bacterium]|nr:GNAT family N-acetyltransferase [Anaerolineae bacterium]